MSTTADGCVAPSELTHSLATFDSPQGMAKNGNDAEIDEGLYSRQL